MVAAAIVAAALPHPQRTLEDLARTIARTAMASGLTLDHIYTSPGVAVPGWRQILKLSGGRFVGVMPSDHNPVVAELLIPA